MKLSLGDVMDTTAAELELGCARLQRAWRVGSEGA